MKVHYTRNPCAITGYPMGPDTPHIMEVTCLRCLARERKDSQKRYDEESRHNSRVHHRIAQLRGTEV